MTIKLFPQRKTETKKQEKVIFPRRVEQPKEQEPKKLFTPRREEIKTIEPIERIFPSRRRLLANFDWTDIANGTGYETYYGLKADDGEYIMSPRILSSEEIGTGIASQSVATTATKYFDFDFDILFNLPRNVKGKAYATIPMGMGADVASSLDFEYYVIVKAVHYDGSTETVLATGQSITTVETLNTGSTKFSARTHQVVMDVTASKHFKKGDILRFTVEGWFKTTEVAARDADLIIGHDPKGRNIDSSAPAEPSTIAIKLANTGAGDVDFHISSVMQFEVPFRIDT